MFVISYESIVSLLHLLLSLFGAIVIFSLIMGRIIAHYPALCFNILMSAFSSFSERLDSVMAYCFNLIAEILRGLALEYILTWILKQVETHYVNNRYGWLYLLVSCSLIGTLAIIILPKEFLFEEIALMVTFSLLIIDKMLNVQHIENQLQQIEQCTNRAEISHKQDRSHEALSEYKKALDIYKMPLLVKNPRFDEERAQLLEKIGIVLHEYGQIESALYYVNKALTIYNEKKKYSIIDQENWRLNHIRVLRKSANILQELGRSDEALKRRQFIPQLVKMTTEALKPNQSPQLKKKFSVSDKIEQKLQKANQYINMADLAYKKCQLQAALFKYRKALKIYNTPFFFKNPSLSVTRADLLEKIGTILSEDNQMASALYYLNQALDIYEKLRTNDNQTLVTSRIRILQKSTNLLSQLGRSGEALQYYQLSNELLLKQKDDQSSFITDSDT